MELETVNKLYLELSQITTAVTAHEVAFSKTLSYIEDQADKLSQQTHEATAYRQGYQTAVERITLAYQNHLNDKLKL